MKRKSLPTGRDFLFVEGYGNENPGAFQSTRPLRGATSDHPWRNLWAWVFQPTRPLRGATGVRRVCIRTTLISTHAPLAGRDLGCHCAGRGDGISTHAPLAGRDRARNSYNYHDINFNPRAPCGARPRHIQRFARAFYFNPRAPCGARPCRARWCIWRRRFQPTRPLRGATCTGREHGGEVMEFQPTRPLRGATQTVDIDKPFKVISTHAPLAGRD